MFKLYRKQINQKLFTLLFRRLIIIKVKKKRVKYELCVLLACNSIFCVANGILEYFSIFSFFLLLLVVWLNKTQKKANKCCVSIFITFFFFLLSLHRKRKRPLKWKFFFFEWNYWRHENLTTRNNLILELESFQFSKNNRFVK